MDLKEELGVASVNELRHVGSRTKRAMGQTEIDEYEEVAPGGMRAFDRLDAQRAERVRDIALALGERGREIIAPSREAVVSAI